MPKRQRHDKPYVEQLSLELLPPLLLPVAPRVSKRCAYPGGKCPYVRATKDNGDLHRLCESHRQKACAYQRNSKAKAAKQQLVEQASGMPWPVQTYPVALPLSGPFQLPVPSLAVAYSPTTGFGVIEPQPFLDVSRLCTYPTARRCHKMRATKSTGELHRFCEDHRDRAARHQSKYTYNKRARGDLKSGDDLRGKPFTTLVHDVVGCLADLPLNDCEGKGQAVSCCYTPQCQIIRSAANVGHRETMTVWEDDICFDALPTLDETRTLLEQLLESDDDEAV